MRRPTHAARTLVFVVVSLMLIAGLSIALARQLVQPDGRINQIAHFGGDALYCVDANRNPTTQLPTIDPKGFRLLNIDGQELWYVPGHDVEAALTKSVIGGDWELIAEGNGTYGPTSLHTYNIGGQNGIFYVFVGYDEHGKSNSLTFQSCTVGSAVSAPPTGMPTASLGPSPTDDPAETATVIPTDGPSPTASDTLTAMNTSTATNTSTSTATSTATDTSTSTATSTATDTATLGIPG